MAKICRVLEKLRQLRTDQLRKSGSVCMLLPLLHFFTIKDSGVILIPPGVGLEGENIDICFTFEGGLPPPGSADPTKTTKQAISLLHSPALSLYNGLNWMSRAT